MSYPTSKNAPQGRLAAPAIIVTPVGRGRFDACLEAGAVLVTAKQFVAERVAQICELHPDRADYLNAIEEDKALNRTHGQFCDLVGGLRAIAESNNLTYGSDAIQQVLATAIDGTADG
jgi:hypothetical protein